MDYAKNIYIKSLGSQENRNKNADIRRLINFDLKVIVYMVSKYLWKRYSLSKESASHPTSLFLCEKWAPQVSYKKWVLQVC